MDTVFRKVMVIEFCIISHPLPYSYIVLLSCQLRIEPGSFNLNMYLWVAGGGGRPLENTESSRVYLELYSSGKKSNVLEPFSRPVKSLEFK